MRVFFENHTFIYNILVIVDLVIKRRHNIIWYGTIVVYAIYGIRAVLIFLYKKTKEILILKLIRFWFKKIIIVVCE